VTDFRNPPRLNGQPVPMKEPPAPITESEHEERLAEIRRYLRRMLVLALGRLREEDLTLLALDQPGLIVGARRQNDKHGAEIVLGVPDEVVVNQLGDIEKRDLIVLVHLPNSAKRSLEGAAKALVLTPEGGTA